MMKPFNLEAAKAGDPVIHRNGMRARIICFERADTKLPLVVLSTDEDSVEHVLTFRGDGKYCAGGESSPYDLFMAPVKREGWATCTPLIDLMPWPGMVLFTKAKNWLMSARSPIVLLVFILNGKNGDEI